MNKRIQKKIEKRTELHRVETLGETAWGRITLSYEQLETAFEHFVHTLGAELGSFELALRGGLKSRVELLDRELGPHIASVPLVGSPIARGLFDLRTTLA